MPYHTAIKSQKESTMDEQKYGIEDLLGLTDSDETSSSSGDDDVMGSYQPVVLDLHNLVKDKTTPGNQQALTKIKKHKKKKKRGQSANRLQSSGSSSTISERSAPTVVEQSKEEFYDAHESYHGLTEYRVPNPVPAAAILQAVSENGPAPKPQLQQPTNTRHESALRRETSSISKPAPGPE